MKLDLSNPDVSLLMEAWGVPYSYGAGAPRDVSKWPLGVPGIHGGIGWDCSGLAQVALVKLNILKASDPDRNANALFKLSKRIDKPEFIGDLIFYGDTDNVSHVVVYLGDGVIIGANGGRSITNADDPKAYVKIDRVNYRSDLVGYGRIT